MSRTLYEITIGHPSAPITIGHPRTFRRLHMQGNYAVFVVTQGPFLRDLYVVGRWSKTERNFQPASAIASFNSEASAIEALKRWAMDPVPPKPLPKVRDSRDHRRNSSRKHKAEIDACQLELHL
jgi:hypothetical protein